ncbi:MAG: hypothetical protein DRI90_14225 [Deltaproteobacteria bacterium]|nr:MAG: hypothetical protein DRI90_14225 [Deltaproteobacteria bacterium]
MSAFNPSEAVTFDLAFGHVHLDGAPSRVMVPADALLQLCQAAGAGESADLAHAIGEALGRRVAVRMAVGHDERLAAVRSAGLDAVVEQLAGELALIGMGALSAERWGKALVLVIDQSPFGEAGDDFLAEVLQAAVHALVETAQSRLVPLAREGVRARFLVVSGQAVEAVRSRLARGDHWGSVIAALHPGGPTS